MLSFKTLVASLAVGGSLLSASAARADSPVALLDRAPVAVTSCAVDYRFSVPTAYNYTEIPSVTGLDVRFENTRRIAANEVDLQVGYGGQEATIVDKGNFAPSTTIAHAFGTFAGSFYERAVPDHCRVVAVRYADGTMWHANDGTPLARTAQK